MAVSSFRKHFFLFKKCNTLYLKCKVGYAVNNSPISEFKYQIQTNLMNKIIKT